MGATYSIERDRFLIRTHVSGSITSPQLLEMYERMIADPHFSAAYNQLADWREVTELRVLTSAVREAAKSHPFIAGTKRAIVVGSDVVYGVARVFAAHAEHVGQDVRVFRDMEDALEWVGLSGGT